MIVTTAGRTNKEMTSYAKKIATELNSSFVIRNDIPVHKLHE
ncbi:protein-L-IsoD(D-D) O-methyltransferase, partial [Bacillus pseudomycoides]